KFYKLLVNTAHVGSSSITLYFAIIAKFNNFCLNRDYPYCQRVKLLLSSCFWSSFFGRSFCLGSRLFSNSFLSGRRLRLGWAVLAQFFRVLQLAGFLGINIYPAGQCNTFALKELCGTV